MQPFVSADKLVLFAWNKYLLIVKELNQMGHFSFETLVNLLQLPLAQVSMFRKYFIQLGSPQANYKIPKTDVSCFIKVGLKGRIIINKP